MTLKILLEKYIDRTISNDEMVQLRRYINDRHYQQELDQLLEELFSAQKTAAIDEHDTDEMFGEMMQKIQSREEPYSTETSQEIIQQPARPVFWWAYIAAALLLSIGAYTWITVAGKNEKQTATISTISNAPIQPGGNKATLILADGSKVVLDSAGNGIISRQGNASITKLSDGKLLYTKTGAPSAVPLYNTISTPKGGQYHLTLSDGSKVWLNAASSITYPAEFMGKERSVSITGEVYFEIEKDPRSPFHVSVGDISVEVLGTHFNVNAYADEKNIRTTLLEGSVQVKNSGNYSMIRPGQQASVVPGNKNTSIKEVDIDLVMAWKNGYFEFRSDDVQTVSRQLERWYDVTIITESGMNDRSFTGAIRRDMDLESVLKVLAYSKVGFEVQGRTIRIKH